MDFSLLPILGKKHKFKDSAIVFYILNLLAVCIGLHFIFTISYIAYVEGGVWMLLL